MSQTRKPRASRGRGRLSSFDLMPSEADHIIAWAVSELSNRDKSQADIHAEFTAMCEALMAEYGGDLTFDIPSLRSFNRFSLRQAVMSRRLDETRQIVAVLAKKHDAQASDDLTVLTSEMIKSTVLYMMGGDADGVGPKDLKALADALRAAQTAQNLSADRRAKITQDVQTRMSEAVDAVAAQKGMTAATAQAIKAEILGVA